MHIQDVFNTHRVSCSFEFFPPKSAAGAESLFQTVRELEALKPAFVSMTYGAGGTTRDLTHDLVVRLKRETTLEPVPHLTCVCHTRAEITDLLARYAQAGVSNILALGGDPPKHLPTYDRGADEFQRASDLVRCIRQFDRENGRTGTAGFGIGVAGFPEGHPSTPNRLQELDYFKAKIDAGADFIITQLFFDNRDFYDFRERCEILGINVPIIAGIMPVTSVEGMKRMAELALGARYPARLLRDLRRCGDNRQSVERVGVHWATEQCLDLIDHGVRGLHFYTLNKSTATLEIYKQLGVADSAGLQLR